MVAVQGDIVVEAAPIIRTFIGEPFVNLLDWMDRGNLFYCHRIG